MLDKYGDPTTWVDSSCREVSIAKFKYQSAYLEDKKFIAPKGFIIESFDWTNGKLRVVLVEE